MAAQDLQTAIAEAEQFLAAWNDNCMQHLGGVISQAGFDRDTPLLTTTHLHTLLNGLHTYQGTGTLPVDGTTVHTRPTVYTVNCLPDDPIDGDLFAVTVEFRGGHAWGEPRPLDQQWAVLLRGHWNLGHDGEWSLKPSSDDDGYEHWIATHRFDLETALKAAAEQAPKVVINGSTPADVLARRARR